MSLVVRRPTNPLDFLSYDTERIRKEYLLEDLMQDGKITMVYTHQDRMIAGGICPGKEPIKLETYDELKSDYFLERRELGIINIGKTGKVTADKESWELENGECLYLGRGTRNVVFETSDGNTNTRFYIISTPAHKVYPNVKQTRSEATVEHLGDSNACNERSIYKFIHPDGIQSCQLVMGYTVLKEGSVWNTMPAHLHDRRSEIYFYFNLADQDRVFHFMGEPKNTRHLVLENEQGIISPSWSIHAGAGTGRYTFIWAMGGENQSFADMDPVPLQSMQ